MLGGTPPRVPKEKRAHTSLSRAEPLLLHIQMSFRLFVQSSSVQNRIPESTYLGNILGYELKSIKRITGTLPNGVRKKSLTLSARHCDSLDRQQASAQRTTRTRDYRDECNNSKLPCRALVCLCSPELLHCSQ